MAAGDLALRVILSADSSSASSVIGNFGQSLSMLSSTPMAAVGIAAAAAGAAMIGFGVKSVQAAGAFQSGMTSLVTGAGELQSNLGMVSQGVLKMSVDTATSTDQLTKGLYMIESAGYHGASGLQVLQTAAEGAKVGNADLGVVSNALTTILTDYHLKATDAAGAMNALVTTVASGKTHMQDLASAMGSVLPLASSLGISFPQVAGAIATMTNSGMDAQRASQNLANAIRSLAAPNSAATKSMKEVGLSAQQLHDVLTKQGLAAAIQLVSDDVGKKFPAGSVQAVTAFKSIMGGATGYNVALMLGGKNMAAYEGNIKNISGAMNSGGNAVQGWSAIQGDFNFKIAQAKQALNVLMIVVGTALLPAIGRIVSAITPVISAFSNMIASGQGVPPLFQQLANAWGQFANNLDVGEILGAFGQFKQTVSTTVSQVNGALGPFLKALNGLFIQIAGYLTGLVAPALQIASQYFAGMGHVVSTMMQAVTGQLIPALHNLVAAVMPIIIAIVQWVADSGMLPVIFNVLSVAVQVVIGVLSFLINVIAAVVTWFATTEVGIATFRAILIVLGVAIGLIAIIILSVVIPAFIAWVAGAIAVGIANVIAFAPIVLIVVAIIAIIAAVILIVQHWGQIAHWLQGAWGAIGAFFVGLWNGIKAGFSAISGAVSGFAQGILQHLGLLPSGVDEKLKLMKIQAQTHTEQMKLQTAATTEAMALKNIANMEQQRRGILAQIQQTTDPVKKHMLEMQAQSIAAAEGQQRGVVQKAAEMKVQSLKHIAELHQKAVEEQKRIAEESRPWWEKLGSGIQSIVGNIGNWLGTTWQNIVNTVSGWFGWLGGQAQQIWNNLVNWIMDIVSPAVKWLESRWQATVNTIVGYFSWLYNHNYYVKMLVDAIAGFFRWIHDTSVAIWNAVASFFVTIWNAIKGAAIAAWNYISGIVTTVNNAIKTFIMNIWNAVVAWFVGVWNTISSKVVQGWQYISGIFSSAWGTYIAGPLGGLGSSISGWFGNLANQAVQWGQNLIGGFVNGIKNMAGQVTGAVQGIMSNVGSFLGFHSPAQKGEGQHIVEWGQNLVKGFVQGMNNAMPLVNGQISHMISAPNVSYAGAQAGNNFALSRPASSSNQPQTVNMQIQLDGRTITEAVGIRLSKEIRLQGAIRNR